MRLVQLVTQHPDTHATELVRAHNPQYIGLRRTLPRPRESNLRVSRPAQLQIRNELCVHALSLSFAPTTAKKIARLWQVCCSQARADLAFLVGRRLDKPYQAV
jgi:hypothetical protein